MVAQYSTDGDMQSNWIDADPKSKLNGLVDAAGSIAAFIGCLIPVFIDKYCSKVTSPLTLDAALIGFCSLICSGLCFLQFFYRDIRILYCSHVFYQLFVTCACTISTSRMTKE